MSELDKLTEYLRAHHYRYTRIDKSMPKRDNSIGIAIDRHQVIVYDMSGKELWDAVCHYGSYGYDEGLLEIMGTIANGDVEGWLTADEIILRLEGKHDKI